MKYARTIFMTLAILGISTFAYSNDSYNSGFMDGFKNGLVEKTAEMEFNFQNDLTFQTGISKNKYVNSQYREGYKAGYTQAYSEAEGSSDPMTVKVATEFTSDNDAFQFGYKHGYNHGMIDSKTGLDFNPRHNHRFDSGLTHDTYRSSHFRSAYSQGYKDGFSQQGTTSSQRVVLVKKSEVEKSKGFATIYSDRGFDGQMQQLSMGRYPNLDDWTNQIESVQVSRNVRVILFDQPNYQGQSIVLEGDTFDLDSFNKRAASMMIVESAE